MAHEQQPPATGAFQIFDGNRIGDVCRVKAGPLVSNTNLKPFGDNPEGNADLLGTVHLVAMLDGIDESFFQGQLDAEQVPFGKLVGLESLLDFLLHASSLCRIAGDFNLPESIWNELE